MRNLRLALVSLLAVTACAGRSPAPAPHPKPDPIGVAPRPAIARAALRAKLAERRQEVFQRFLAYREARRYPLSPGPGRQHIWIDARGYLCAAATMISADWGRDATVAAVGDNLGIRLADVKSGAFADWMLTSGLTQYELVAIKVPGFEYDPEPEGPEVATMYPLYVEVGRQSTSQWDANLELASPPTRRSPAPSSPASSLPRRSARPAAGERRLDRVSFHMPCRPLEG